MLEINLTTPIQIVSEQSVWQFLPTLLIGSLVTIYFFYKIFRQYISDPMTYISLFKLKRMLKQNVMLIRHNQSSFLSPQMINRKDIGDIAKAFTKFKGKPFTLVLQTPGGEVFSGMLISRMLKNYKGKITSLVPHYSMSGGTILALSTDAIKMSRHACLGPVDPQIGGLLDYGSAKGWKDVVKLKKGRSKDSSIIYKLIGSQVEKDIRDYIYGLIPDRKFARFMTSGGMQHGSALTFDRLKQTGLSEHIPLSLMTDKVAAIVGKMAVLESDKGVYYL